MRLMLGRMFPSCKRIFLGYALLAWLFSSMNLVFFISQVKAAAPHHFAIDNGFAVGGAKMAGTPFSMTIRALDENGNIVTDFNGSVFFTDLSNTVSPTQSSNFTNGVWNGQVTVTKAINANTITAFYSSTSVTSTQFNVVPDTRFTVLALLSGNNQSGVAGSTLPTGIQVKAIDQYGNAVSNEPVNFLIAGYPPNSTGQSLTVTGGTTDTNGRLDTSLKLGTKVGTYTVTAKLSSANSQQLNIYANATAGPLANLDLSPLITIVPKGASQQFILTGVDQYKNPVNLTTPTWSVIAGGGTIDSNGVFKAGSTSGNFVNTVKAQVGSIGALASVTVIN
ncbi:MAG: putative immunogloblin, partial [Patescibacteria group bacterium]|nr:putative immunogloblin [Patescibacteria group bacterium]